MADQNLSWTKTSTGEQISLFGTMQSDHLSAALPVPNESLFVSRGSVGPFRGL